MASNKEVLLMDVEYVILQLIVNMNSYVNITIKVPSIYTYWSDLIKSIDTSMGIKKTIHLREITYKSRYSRHRFCLIMFLLAEIHRLLLFGGSSTLRGLYYRDTQMIISQSYIAAARIDVCRILNTTPLHLGILSSSKGLISGVCISLRRYFHKKIILYFVGDIKLYMNNGDVVDCNLYSKAIALPTDMESVDRIITNAELVLIVEKESVFESLLTRKSFSTFDLRCILVTGKGYPDFVTRRIVHRLSFECNLPAYILVDADPFGIEIMLIYQYGSQSMNFCSKIFATPMIQWIGLHPSEICSISKTNISLTNYDNKKIVDILCRKYISSSVRHELCTLQKIQLKAEIESIIDFLFPYYIQTKINRNLFLQ